MVGQMRSTRSRRTDPTDIAGTPWARSVNKLELGDELNLFREFMSLQEDEEDHRQIISKRIQMAVTRFDSNSTVKPCGEYGYGMSRFAADLDLVAEVFDGNIDDLAIELVEQNSWEHRMEITIVSKEPSFLRLRVTIGDDQTVFVNLTVSNEIRTVQRKTATTMRNLLQGMPNVASASFALEFIMKSALTEQFNKLSLFLIVIGYAQSIGPESIEDGGEFLLSFMHYMSKTFDPATTAVDVTRGGMIARSSQYEKASLVVIHPVTGENLTQECDSLSVIRIKMTMHCVSQMEVAERELKRLAEVTSDKPRTVLSTVIAYHEYWPRSFKLNRSRKLRGKDLASLRSSISITSQSHLSMSDESSSQQSSQQ